ncbi:MAG: hypothetical protein EBY09_10640 [Verrucomicrobia bacterium]|nr:hypothetical protein [Verrucomicrobiota bacterium]NDE98853.1 hypothetical protein [Verrucomicrobiota bacterium]
MKPPSQLAVEYSAEELATFRRKMTEQDRRMVQARRMLFMGAEATGLFGVVWDRVTASGWMVWCGLLPLGWVL